MLVCLTFHADQVRTSPRTNAEPWCVLRTCTASLQGTCHVHDPFRRGRRSGAQRGPTAQAEPCPSASVVRPQRKVKAEVFPSCFGAVLFGDGSASGAVRECLPCTRGRQAYWSRVQRIGPMCPKEHVSYLRFARLRDANRKTRPMPQHGGPAVACAHRRAVCGRRQSAAGLCSSLS